MPPMNVMAVTVEAMKPTRPTDDPDSTTDRTKYGIDKYRGMLAYTGRTHTYTHGRLQSQNTNTAHSRTHRARQARRARRGIQTPRS